MVKLVSYYNSKFVNIPVKTVQITKVIHDHIGTLRSETCVAPKEFTACSFWAEGAIALLLDGCDK